MVEIKGMVDNGLQVFANALRRYQEAHLHSDCTLYRQNAASIRIRVVDEDFRDLLKTERYDLVWEYFKGIPESTLNDLSVLLTLTPEEVDSSFANFEFENPVSSQL